MKNISHKLILFLTLIVILTSCSKISEISSQEIIVPAYHLSYFQQDKKSNLALKNNLPYPSTSQEYVAKKSFSPKNTALFVIDPWNNNPSKFLNDYYGNITQKYILPLVIAAVKSGFEVYIFTNDCNRIKPKAYSCTIPTEFYNEANSYQNAHIIYWQHINANHFVMSLQNHGIKKLIYTGFASNMCVIGRPLGMIPMKLKGFTLYYIPQASAAVETETTWKSQTIHKNMTLVISQWLAEIINFQDLYKSLNS